MERPWVCGLLLLMVTLCSVESASGGVGYEKAGDVKAQTISATGGGSVGGGVALAGGGTEGQSETPGGSDGDQPASADQLPVVEGAGNASAGEEEDEEDSEVVSVIISTTDDQGSEEGETVPPAELEAQSANTTGDNSEVQAELQALGGGEQSTS